MSFLSRLLLTSAGLFLALPLAGCQTTVTGCETPFSGGAELPDPSFEEAQTPWKLASHSRIDDTEGVCDGTHSLLVQLDSGLGSTEPTQSANLTGITADKEYEITFHYRFENGNKAGLRLTTGKYTKSLKFDGSDGRWKQTTLAVTFGSDPVSIAIYPEREGLEGDFQGESFDKNLMWVDDFTIKDVAGSN